MCAQTPGIVATDLVRAAVERAVSFALRGKAACGGREVDALVDLATELAERATNLGDGVHHEEGVTSTCSPRPANLAVALAVAIAMQSIGVNTSMSTSSDSMMTRLQTEATRLCQAFNTGRPAHQVLLLPPTVEWIGKPARGVDPFFNPVDFMELPPSLVGKSPKELEAMKKTLEDYLATGDFLAPPPL